MHTGTDAHKLAHMHIRLHTQAHGCSPSHPPSPPVRWNVILPFLIILTVALPGYGATSQKARKKDGTVPSLGSWNVATLPSAAFKVLGT